MLTEIVVQSAVEAVVGQGFSALVKRLFRDNQAASDRELLQIILREIARHGARVDDVELRISELERYCGDQQSHSRPSETSKSATPVPALDPPALGRYFLKASGGPSRFFEKKRKT